MIAFPLPVGLVLAPILLVFAARDSASMPRSRQTLTSSAGLERDELVLRNSRLSFTAGAAERARATLQAFENEGEAKPSRSLVANALLCIGAGGDASDVPVLERYAGSGKLSLRRAALFAIGELGVQGFGALDRLLSRELVGAEEVALLALIHMDQGSLVEPRLALQRVLNACTDERPGVSQAALFLRSYALGGPVPSALPALDSYYELRWSAACDYGFVDGVRWNDLQLATLIGNDSYLNRFVLGLASSLDQERLTSHIIELLAGEHSAGCAAGVILHFPGVLPALYSEGGWRPASLAEWVEVILAVQQLPDSSGYEAMLNDAFGVMARAKGMQALRDQAAFLLLGAGEEPPRAWINAATKSKDSDMQSRLLEVAGQVGSEPMRAYAQNILDTSKSPSMAIKAQLALARMGDVGARDALSHLLTSAPLNIRLLGLEAMEAVSRDPGVRAWVRELTRGVELHGEALHLQVLSLAWETPTLEQRERIRQTLRSGIGSHASRLRSLGLLMAQANADDEQLFRELFPSEISIEFNLLLARELSGLHDSHSLEALRRLLWGDNWNLSVIAGGVAQRMFGTSFLHDELATPPDAASDHNLRSVGFSLGEWAGLSAVEELARSHTARDPALQGAFLGALSTSDH